METAYFVMHPTLGVTGVVYAPTTEKARTTFLDWLERNNHIRRADRQAFRKNMGAQRLDDPNVPSDVVLHYGYEEGSSTRYRLPATEEESRLVAGESPEEVYYPDLTEEEEGPLDGEKPEEVYYPERPIEPPRTKLMPIQQVMLRGFAK